MAAIAYQLRGETSKALASRQLLELARLQGAHAEAAGQGQIAASGDDLRDDALGTVYDARLAVAPTVWTLLATCGANPFNLNLPTPFQRWQVRYFGSTNNPAAAPGTDADGDGMINRQKFLAGTRSINPKNVLRLTRIQLLGSDVKLKFASVTNLIWG